MKTFHRSIAALLPEFWRSLSPRSRCWRRSDLEQVEVSVGRLLEEGHYTHQPLNDEISKKFLTGYLELLDFSHLFFTQQDVDAFYREIRHRDR